MDTPTVLTQNEALGLVRKYKQVIAPRFNNDVEVMMFGAYAKGKARPWSDIDVAVIVPKVDEDKWLTSNAISGRRSSKGLGPGFAWSLSEENKNTENNLENIENSNLDKSKNTEKNELLDTCSISTVIDSQSVQKQAFGQSDNPFRSIDSVAQTLSDNSLQKRTKKRKRVGHRICIG